MMKKEITLRQATPRDTDTVTDLALLLWPGHGREALRQEMEAFCTREDAAAFLASADGVPVGFAACALRWEYVEGTEQSPAGYLEGIFVAAAFRRCGAAAGLLRRCEAWAKEKGCAEFASDCELENEESRCRYDEEVVETYGYVCKFPHLYYPHTKAHYHRQPS